MKRPSPRHYLWSTRNWIGRDDDDDQRRHDRVLLIVMQGRRGWIATAFERIRNFIVK